MGTISHGLRIAVTISTIACTGHAPGVTPEPATGFADGFDANVRRDVETLRAATNKYHDLAAAEAAGYPTTMPRCVADSTMGGMGHHLNDRKAFDDKLDHEHPEMLIYAADGEGKPELVAVEYIMPYRVAPPTEKPPRLFGQEFKRYDQYNYWGLHVWAWRRNAAGLFADWNPAVRC
jgi:hypothetical protein